MSSKQSRGPGDSLLRTSSVLGAVLVLSVFILPSCGYQFMVEGSGPTIGAEPAPASDGPPVRLSIRRFKNRTFETNLELKYTDYVRREFASGSGAEVIRSESGADFLLTGEIVQVILPSLTFSQKQTRETRVIVTVRATVEQLSTGKVVWNQTATGTGEFFVGLAPADRDDLQFNRVLQNRALEQAGQLIAADLANRFFIARDQQTFSLSSAKVSHGTPAAVGNMEKPTENVSSY